MTAVVLVAVLTVPTIAAAGVPMVAPHAAPAPTIDSVQKQLGQLAMKNDELVDEYDRATMAYKKTKIASAKATRSYRAVKAQLAKANAQLSASATATYEGGTFSAAGALLSSSSGSDYLDQLDTLSMLSSHNSQVVSSYAATKAQAKQAKQKATNLFAKATANRTKLAKQRVQTQQQINKFTALLSSLNAKERAAWASSSSPTVAQSKITAARSKVVHITSAQVRVAVKFAIAQVGKPYVWGSGGPSSYDCSGLTMASYAAAGISLPHSAADQYNYGHHVAESDLQPGDLMFYYRPRIGHVTMYIGDGLMVSAPTAGEDVKIIPADSDSSDYVGATRLVAS